MDNIVLTSRVGVDGVLHVTVPVGAAEANQEVRVTIESLKPALTQEEWRAHILSLAGSITDPTFRRHEQGEYEKRDEL